MRKRRGSGFFAGIFVGVLFSMTFFLVMYFLDIQILPASSLASDIRNRAEIVESYIDSYYWKDDVSDQTISEYAAKGMVAALGDKYSAYFTSEELKSSMEDVEGDYEGIGASVRYDEKQKQDDSGSAERQTGTESRIKSRRYSAFCKWRGRNKIVIK